MADAPPPPPLPPDLAEALRQGNPLRLIGALLKAASTPAPGQPGSTPPQKPAARGRAVSRAAGKVTPKPATTHAPDLDADLPLIAAPGLSPGEVPRSQSLAWLWVVVLLLAYLAYRYWLA